MASCLIGLCIVSDILYVLHIACQNAVQSSLSVRHRDVHRFTLCIIYLFHEHSVIDILLLSAIVPIVIRSTDPACVPLRYSCTAVICLKPVRS